VDWTHDARGIAPGLPKTITLSQEDGYDKMVNRYSPEVCARAVWMVLEHQGSYETRVGTIAAIAPKVGCIPQILGERVKQAEQNSGRRDRVMTGSRRSAERTESCSGSARVCPLPDSSTQYR
jgi:transposase